MIRNYFSFFCFITFFLSCNAQENIKKNNEILRAKWFFYSYSSGLVATDTRSIILNPLVCDLLMLRFEKHGEDTSRIYFIPYYKDTLNICSLKPTDLVGVMIIRHKLYMPIYHLIVYDSESDDKTLKRMKQSEETLKASIIKNKNSISQWLFNEAKVRKII